MTDDKKIEAAARRYSEVTDCDKQEALLIEEGFKEGANWAINEPLNELWHPASEEQRKDVSIIEETHNDKNMFYYAWNRWQDNLYPSWTDAVLCSRVSRWLYIDDLFLKEGD